MQTPQQSADAWASNMQASSTKIKNGIAAVQESPTAKAAAAAGKYLSRVQDAVSSGKFAQKLNAVTLEQWKAAATAKVDRIGSGAAAAKPKMLKHLTNFLPFVANVRQQVKSMPSTTPGERIARMVQNATLLSQYKSPG